MRGGCFSRVAHREARPKFRRQTRAYQGMTSYGSAGESKNVGECTAGPKVGSPLVPSGGASRPIRSLTNLSSGYCFSTCSRTVFVSEHYYIVYNLTLGQELVSIPSGFCHSLEARKMAQERPVKKAVSATQGAYVELKRRILEGELPEGSPIRQDEVAAQLGVSKIPVREALMRLQSEGLVSFTPNVGAVVTTLTVVDYIEMLDMRLALECRALELAVPNMASVDFARARELLAAYHSAMTDQEWSDLNVQFHETLYEPANRPRLLGAIRSVQEHMGRRLRLRVTMAARHDRSHDEHVKILEACERGDVKDAVRLLRKHIEQSQREVQGYFRDTQRRVGVS